MKYKKIWDKVLNSNEQIKYEFSVSTKYLKMQLISWIVLAVMLLTLLWSLLPLSIFLIIVAVIQYFYVKNSNAYAFTSNRVLIHKGWLSTSATSINYDKITEVSVIEPFLSRVVSQTGDLIIHTGNVIDGLVLKNIEAPYEIKKKLDSLRNIE